MHPALTAMEVTVAEWQLGIPPSPTSLERLISLYTIECMMNFNIWATNQPVIPIIRTLFSNNEVQISLNIVSFVSFQKYI
jgi:hypothetical protein